MKTELDDTFLAQLNENLCIAHKVSNLYFRDSEERDDVLQEMMYQLWRSYGNFRGTAKFSTWMYSVCLNTAITYLKKVKKHSNEKLQPEHDNIAVENDEEVEEERRLLYKAIDALSPLNKSITLLYLEGFPYEEIAAITGLSKSNVSVRLVRIRRSLEDITKTYSHG